MVESVPLGVGGRLAQPVRAGKVDHHAAGRGVELRRPLMLEADEDDVGAACQRLLVRHEGGSPAAAVAREARIERRRALAGQRVRAEREEVELGVGEHTVERLLPGVAGGTDDGGERHVAYYADAS